MKFFSVPNHRSSEAEIIDPLSYRPDIPAAASATKSAFRAWSANVTTKHAFITAIEGVNPHERVTEHNPPALVHGFIADYDSPAGDDPIGFVRDKGGDPTYFSSSYSGHLRLVWEFTEPVPVTAAVAEEFMKQVAKTVNAVKLFPGYDETSTKPIQLFEIGTKWKKIGPSLSPTQTQSALFKAYNKGGYVASDIQIPVDVVADEVSKRWPGRWKGSFELEARGPLFWIDDGIDRDGCQIKPDGMLCFSDRAGKGFLSWREILGQGFVGQYEEKKIAGALTDFWFDGQKYWRTTPGYGITETQESLTLALRKMGFSPKAKKGAPLSEVEEAIYFIQSANRVDGAAPLIFDPNKVAKLPDGRRIVNTSRVRAIEPAAEGDISLWPWTWNYINSLFDEAPMGGVPAHDFMWAWLARAYGASYRKEAVQGQAIILAGEAGRGKTLFGRMIVGALCGGWADASAYLAGGTNFNKEISEMPVWNVDDAVSAVDHKEQRRFTELLKKAVANPSIESHRKGVDSQIVPWTGRVVMSVNLDAHSLSAIPNLDQSNRDKIMAFQTPIGGDKIKFPSNAEVKAILDRELPHMARWLLDYEPNPKVIGNARYGVRSYFHPAVETASRDASPRQHILEMIEIFVQEVRVGHNKPEWKGSSTQLAGLMSEIPILRSFTSLRNTNIFGRDLAAAEEHSRSNEGTVRPIRSINTGSGKKWTISLDPKYDHAEPIEA